MILWTILQFVAALPMVVLPFGLQARESLNPPMNPVTLGTFGIVMMAAFYFAIVGLVNGIIAAGRAGWPWYAGFGVGVLAAAVGVVASYWLLYAMATKGGSGITIAGGLGLAILISANVIGPRLI